MTAYRAIFRATEEAMNALAMHLPGLTFEPCEDADTFWVGGNPLELDECSGDYRAGLQAFVDKANCLIALIDANLTAVQSLGSIEVIKGEARHRICLVEPAHIEFVGMPIILSARGTTRSIRPMAERAIEFRPQDERFSRATTMFAACGDDMRELFKVVELIERAHGGQPKKSSPSERKDFFQLIEVSGDDWDALHRSFRPMRHAEPHDMQGRTISPRLARILVQHALKLWLAREMPE